VTFQRRSLALSGRKLVTASLRHLVTAFEQLVCSNVGFARNAADAHELGLDVSEVLLGRAADGVYTLVGHALLDIRLADGFRDISADAHAQVARDG
jgi:hypothetical protein